MLPFADVYKMCGQKLKGKIGVLPLPGSTVVYDRDSDTLVPCTSKDVCPNVSTLPYLHCIHTTVGRPEHMLKETNTWQNATRHAG